MNHTIAALKWRGALLVAYGGLVATTLFACGSDDNSSGNDASGTDGSMVGDSGMMSDGAGGDSKAKPDTSGDSPVADGPNGSDSGYDGAEAGSDADAGGDGDTGADASDSAVDGSVGDASDGGDATVTDTGADAGPPMPLNLCPVLDTDWALMFAPDAGWDTIYSARQGAWGNDIALTPPNSFSEALTNDCNVNGIEAYFSDGGADGVAAYITQINEFTLQFFGCGLPEAGALSFSGLIPLGAQNHTFTMADLNEFARLYANAVNAEASINWAANLPGTPEPLTIGQLDQIQSLLQALEAAMPGVNQNTTHFTLSTCGNDAGSDSGNTGGDSGGD